MPLRFFLGFATLALALATPDGGARLSAQAAVDPGIDLPISVRTHVERPFGGFRRKPPPVHGKTYALISIAQTQEAPQIVKPISENAILAQLRLVLGRQGFREIAAGEAPEILLTVHYGRGFLRNPYMRGVIENTMTDPPTITIIGATPEYLINSRQAGYELKRQKAQAEKLFLRVTAWAPPQPAAANGKKPEPQVLWHTTMIHDDARRDLNLVYQDMLESGAPLFDKELKVEEVEIRKRSPQGTVEVGTPEVVAPPTAPKP